MANPFEQASFGPDLAHSPGLSEALGPHQKHRERIQNELREFLSADEARETATRAYRLKPGVTLAAARGDLDAMTELFAAHRRRLFHTAFDGLHLLRSLSDSILQAFFRGREKHSAIGWLLDELGKHAWVAKIRRMNWEESHTLGLVPKEVLEAILMGSWERGREAGADPPRLSLEEQAFFQSFEEQMERQG